MRPAATQARLALGRSVFAHGRLGVGASGFGLLLAEEAVGGPFGAGIGAASALAEEPSRPAALV